MKSRKFKPKLVPRSPRRETEFIRVLDGWRGLSAEDPFMPGTMEFIFSPERKVYRRAHGWETPDLVIDADILPPAHHIRLVRVRAKVLRLLARRMLRQQAEAARRAKNPRTTTSARQAPRDYE